MYRCKICGLEFSNYRKLGGHFSNRHPGESKEFNKKKEIRFKRTLERKAYKRAKE